MTRISPRRHWALTLSFVSALVLSATPSPAVQINVTYTDGGSEGFNDPGLGAARRSAFEYAANIWAALLGGSVTIVVDAQMNSLGGSGSSATLGQAGATLVFRDFSGAPMAGTWYPIGLANQLAGTDLDAGVEIEATFNGDVDNGTVLGSTDWYYGTDQSPGGDIDFVAVVLHEIGHGLGFFDMVDQSTGTWPSGYPDIFGIQLTRLGLAFTAMSDATRLAAITSGQVRWSGSSAVADNGGTEPLIYAPSPYESGSSMSHWDTSLSPDELMEPFYAGANHDPGLALAAFEDLGWSISGGPPPTGGPTTTITTTTTTTTLPLLDPFLCYKSKTTKKTPKFSPVLGVELVNTFETATTNIMKPKNLCNPSAVGTGPLLDVGTHLVAYTIASSPKHLPRPTVLITDQFGSFFVRTVKAERLLTPSAQSLTGPQLKLDPASHNVDNFKCYKVKLVKGSEKPYKKQQVTVTDEFTTAKAFIVKKPKRLCRPASMNGVGIKNTAANLICYAVKPAKNQPKTAKRKGIHTANELGVVQLDTKKEELVCLPAVTNVF